MTYRLALDIGANSIGWCLFTLDSATPPAPTGIRDIGVRVFPDGREPKTNASLAGARRMARQMRRRRDRYLQRRTKLLNALTRYGLMPADAEARQAVARLDPYLLRAEALSRRLEPHELGRVIFHLNQRRGFRSNRKVDRGNQEEKGKIRLGTDRLATELSRGGFATLGAWLADRHEKRVELRARLRGSGARAEYPFYPARDMIEAEFDTIWAAQAGWNPALLPAMRDDLRTTLFHQRPLRKPPVGKCWLEPKEDRAPRALPSTQAFRIAQDLANLAIRRMGMPDQPLTGQQRDVLYALLTGGQDLSFPNMRKQLGLTRGETFNLESRARDAIKGSATAQRLAGKTGPLRALWTGLPLATQDEIARLIDETEDEPALIAALERLGIPRDAASAAAGITLPDGHASLSSKAMLALLPHLRAGKTYDKAVQLAGYAHHSDDRDGVIYDRLPYYGELLAERLGTGSGDPDHPAERRFGRAPNPTVHVALNQLRHVVNAIIARHGPPAQVVVEVLRELAQSAQQRADIEKEQRENAKRREEWVTRLTEMKQRPTGRNMDFMRLWHEQADDPKDRVCPYTGVRIGIEQLFTGEVEEDHILPFAISLDDSFANRVLVTREANRRKGRLTPHQAFGGTAEWGDILARAKTLRPAKAWRFAPDALEKWRGEHSDFLARHLTDSAYLARLARLYMRAVCDPDQVWVVPGRLTGLVRRTLGLNSASLLGKGGARKERTDHRHHAIDALTIGLIDRSLLQRVATAARRAENTGRRLLDDMAEPWPGFVAEAAARVRGIVVSHKPDTAPAGQLLKDTAFGPVAGRADGRNVRVRRMIGDLADWKPSDTPKKGQPLVADADLRQRIDGILRLGEQDRRRSLDGLTDAGGTQVRRVRTLQTENRLVGIVQPGGEKIYKLLATGENHRLDIWRSINGEICPRVVSIFEAANETARRGGAGAPAQRPHPAAKLMLRLHKGDAVAVGTGANRTLLVVKGIWEKIVELAPPYEAGSLGTRDRDDKDAFKMIRIAHSTLIARNIRKIHVDPSGRVRDPGPLDW